MGRGERCGAAGRGFPRPGRARSAPGAPMSLLGSLGQFALGLNRAARRDAPDDFVARAFEAIAGRLRLDAATWLDGHLGADGLPRLHGGSAYRGPPRMIDAYLPIAHEDPSLAGSMRRPGESIAADVSRLASPAMADWLRHWGLAHALASSVADPLTGSFTAIGLWRSEASGAFGSEERVFVQAVIPILVEARTHNRLLHLVQAAAPPGSDSWLPAIADRRGLLLGADDRFIELLREEWPPWRGPRLPAPLEQAVRQGPGPRYNGRRLVCKAAVVGDTTLLQVRRSTPVDRLTPREREIAVYTAQGLTHKEIARLLEVAPTTVRTHLTASCRRLGVRNKAQMAALVSSLQ